MAATPDLSKLSSEQLIAMLKGGSTAPAEIPQELPEPVSPLVRIGQGMNDVYGGIKQKYLNMTDPAAAEKYTRETNENNDIVAKGRAAWGEGGFDPLRMVGSIATPLSALPLGGAGVIGRTALGAAAGGAAGYANFDPTNTTASNTANAAVGAVGGGVLNAAAPPVLGALIQGGQAVAGAAGNAWRSLVQKVSPDVVTNISQKIQVSLQNAGIDFGKLSEGIKASVLDDAAQQLQMTGKLDPEMLLRKADIEAVGGAGSATKAQVTQNPQEWTTAQNLQKTEMNMPAVMRGEQETLTSRLQGQNASTNQFAQSLGERIGRADDPLWSGGQKAATPLQASEQAIKAIQEKDASAQKAVGELYSKFKELGKGDVSVPDTKIAETLGRVADEIGVENIPPAVLSRMKEFGFLGGERTKLLTVNEADKLGRLIGNNNPGHGTASKVSVELKRAVDNAILDIPEIEASKALMTARDAARARFAARESGLGVERAIADVAPDRFFQQNVIGGNVRDIVAMKEQLGKTVDGGNAWNSLREQAMKWIKDKATSENGVFSGTRMHDAMKQIGPDRLEVIFTKPELVELETLLRGSKAMTTEPAFAAPNRSNTTPAALGAMLRLGNKTPVVNMVTAPIAQEFESSAQQRLLANALDGGDLAPGQAIASALKRSELVKMLLKDRAYNPSMVPTAAHEQYKPR